MKRIHRENFNKYIEEILTIFPQEKLINKISITNITKVELE